MLFYLAFLNNHTLIYVSRVCKQYALLVQTKAIQEVMARNFAFGASAWKTYFGIVDEEPPLPWNLHELLAKPCPIFPGKKLREMFILTLIPTMVNDQPLTLMTFKALVEKSKQGAPINFHVFQYSDIFKTCATRAHWVLVSRRHIPNSLGKAFKMQKKMIEKWEETTKIPCRLPTILQASISLVSHCIRSQVRLYQSNYMRCRELHEVTGSLMNVVFFPLTVLEILRPSPS